MWKMFFVDVHILFYVAFVDVHILFYVSVVDVHILLYVPVVDVHILFNVAVVDVHILVFVAVVDVDAPGEEKTGVEKAVKGDVDVGVRDSSIFPAHFCNCLYVKVFF